jgi:hypothetical protein
MNESKRQVAENNGYALQQRRSGSQAGSRVDEKRKSCERRTQPGIASPIRSERICVQKVALWDNRHVVELVIL